MRKTPIGVALLGGALVGFATGRDRLRRFEVTESSMAPALENGDYVVARHLLTKPKRGDVIVFPHPRDPAFLMIKRVIGLPGEQVAIRRGRLAVDGRILAEPWAAGALMGRFDWQLGANELLVLSDNRRVSTEDSRELGPLPMGEMWRVAFRYWPAARIGRLGRRR